MADQQPLDFQQYRPSGERIPQDAPQKPTWQMTAPEKFSLAIARGYVDRGDVERDIGTKDITTVFNSDNYRGLDAALTMGSRKYSNGKRQEADRTIFTGIDGKRGRSAGF